MAWHKVDNKVNVAYKYCLNIVKQHYENFAVASIILPTYLRYSIAAIYAFARTADDFADIGNCTSAQRLQKLNFLQVQIDLMPNLNTDDYILIALQDTVIKHNLPKNLLIDLLSAFKQDVEPQNYTTFAEILSYCRYSANPIGRLLLHLTGNNLEENYKLSDNICTGLQLINFLQDLQDDLSYSNRCYIPEEDLSHFGVSKLQLKNGVINPAVNNLILYQYKRAAEIYTQGIYLGSRLKGLFGIELRMIIAGGLCILNKLEKRVNPYLKPVVTKIDKIKIFFQATGGKLSYDRYSAVL